MKETLQTTGFYNSYSFKRRTIALIFIYALFISAFVFAQPASVVKTVTPEAMLYAQYLDNPVNKATGVSEVSIPVFELQSGELKLPVLLSNYGGGFKANQMSTWVGMSWDLNAELEISCSVKGKLDNDKTLAGKEPLNYWESEQVILPDEFQYRLLSGGGKFYFIPSANSYKIVSVPFSNIQISFNATENSFQILDTDGTLYRYGRSLAGEQVTEMSLLNNLQNNITSWKCTEIISHSKKDTLFFEYYPELKSYTYLTVNNHMEVVKDGTYTNGWENIIAYNNIYESPGSDAAGVYKFTQGSTDSLGYDNYWAKISDYGGVGDGVNSCSTMSRRLKQVSGRGGKLIFNKPLNYNRLESIQLQDYLGNDVKTIKFYQSSFQTNPRFALDSIHIYGRNSSVYEPYKFSYTSTYSYYPYEVGDFWGFPSYFFTGPQRGYTAADNLFDDDWAIIPQAASNIFSPNLAFAPQNSSVTFEWLLNKITYPGGGYTKFTYGYNYYKSMNLATYIRDQVSKCGGIRLEKASYYDGIHNTPAKEFIYKYGINESGIGVPTAEPSPESYKYAQTTFYVTNLDIVKTEVKRTYFSQSLREVFSFPISYPEVAVYQTDLGQLTGKTVYKYDTIEHQVTTMAEWEQNPNLRSEAYFGYNGVNYQLIKEKTYDYTTLYTADYVVMNQNFRDRIVLNGDGSERYLKDQVFWNYAHANSEYQYARVGKIGLLRMKEMHCEPGTVDTVTSDIQYFYDNPAHLLPTRTQYTDSKGSTKLTFTTYPQDYPTNDAEVSNLLAAHKYNLPIEQVAVSNLNNLNTVTSGWVNTYEHSEQGYKKTAETLDTDAPVDLNSFKFSNTSQGQFPAYLNPQNFIKDGHYTVKTTCDFYDNYGNLTQLTLNGSQKVSYQWGYQGQYVTAECKNAAKDEFYFNGFEADGNVIGDTHTGSHSFNGTFTTTDKLAPGFNGKNYILSWWSKSGGIWIFNLQPYTGQLITGQLDDVRIYPANAQMTTYTYDPIIGMTSQTDTKGLTITYAYDALNRLKTIRDNSGKILKSMEYHYKIQ